MDPDTICGADDKLLEDLGLCAKGDICALRSYCQGWNSSSTPSGSFTQSPESCRQERKRKLMAILQSGKKTRLKQNVAETSTKSKKPMQQCCYEIFCTNEGENKTNPAWMATL
ncbi:Hypothetical predicted protein [Paramuricea clavata]|uniref:Uncharacterized protein n=1 Tax=Paramuricea clavata TaxID=317549 RepID=A0A7D9IF85_PARCT|nr:Hypothetical predicted protein [Paramuricea clavata]